MRSIANQTILAQEIEPRHDICLKRLGIHLIVTEVQLTPNQNKIHNLNNNEIYSKLWHICCCFFFLNLGETHKKPRRKHHIDTYHNQDQVGMFDKHSLTLNMSDKLLSS